MWNYYVVFPYKILIHYNCTHHCQKTTDEKDGTGNWPMCIFW
jgi:hypothetical protein